MKERLMVVSQWVSVRAAGNTYCRLGFCGEETEGGSFTSCWTVMYTQQGLPVQVTVLPLLSSSVPSLLSDRRTRGPEIPQVKETAGSDWASPTALIQFPT